MRSARMRAAAAGVLMLVLLGTLVLAVEQTPLASADHGTGHGQSFLFLLEGFTQDIYGVRSGVDMGGVAFAPNGDPLVVDGCDNNRQNLSRFQHASTPPPVNGTNIHTRVTLASNAGCGLTNHPNGSLYSNLSSGVVRLNADTGAQTGGPGGGAGNSLAIGVDPLTGNIVFATSDSSLRFVTPDLTTSACSRRRREASPAAPRRSYSTPPVSSCSWPIERSAG